MIAGFNRSIAVAAAAALLLLAGCERPPMESTQIGYRGTGMEQVTNPRLAAAKVSNNVVPDAEPAASPDGPKARDIYKNVQVLGDLSIAEFTRSMAAMTAWVAPNEGCAYCHNLQNLADDSKYTKVVSRRMTQMTQHLNVDWKSHVANTGVTCYTCHRGNNIPKNVWFEAPDQGRSAGMLGNDGGQNHPAAAVGLASLPYEPFAPYLLDNQKIADIRVNGPTALPTGNRHSIKQAEHTYGLMMTMSSGLGVNCTYCHNTRSFQSWDGPPARAIAYYGIRMVGDQNANYLEPLTKVFPQHRLGPTGDVAKINCATCHQGVNKPLNGAQMAKDYPAFTAVTMTAVQAPMDAASGPAAVAAAAEVSAAAVGLSGVLGKVLFAVGDATLDTPSRDTIGAAATLLKARPEIRVALSGYADRTGNADGNLDLAKRRALAVSSALIAAGVDKDRIEMKKPEFTVGGNDVDSRRVDIVAAR